MQFFIRFEVFDTITDDEEIASLHQAIGGQIEKILGSGKVTASGIFADARAGFFLMDIDGAEDIFELLGTAFIDHCRLETHPVISLEQSGEFFKKEAGG